MIFRQRTSEPSYTDKYWIQTGSGGYNKCIYASGNSVLPNCFTGDTKIQTDKGTFSLKKLLGTEIKVPTMDGVMRSATINYFGRQKIWEVHLNNSSVYKCTGNHRWVVFDSDRTTWRFIETQDLEIGMAIKYSKYNLFTTVVSVKETNRVKPVYCAVEPETHMFTLENGELTGNCVGYAYGRFMEVMGATSCNLSTHNAGTWYGNTSDGYARGKTPRVGAVICWSRPGQAGHVAIVEQVNADGSIVTSNSAWKGTRWYIQTLKPPAYTWSSNYNFQGFIYNPAVPSSGIFLGGSASGLLGGAIGSTVVREEVNKTQEFLDIANKYVGADASPASFIASQIGGYPPGTKWSCRYVMACANKIGIIGKAIPNATNPSDIGKNASGSGIGSWINPKKAPEPGDLLMIRNNLNRSYKTYDCDKVAIITQYKKNQIYVIEGDCDNKVKIKSYQHGDPMICAYYRPKWEAVNSSGVDGDVTELYGDASAGVFQMLYNTMNTKEDAIVREFGYVNDKYEKTTSKNNIRLSAINYTTTLTMSMLGGGSVDMSSLMLGSSGTDVILDGVQNQNCRTVIQFLMSKGLNAAASVGIAANIQHESCFNTAAKGDYKGGVPTSFGICQWHYERGTAMKSMCGGAWENNLTGQLNYLWYELNNSYRTKVLQVLATVPNNESGAKQAADVFVRKFEVPANINSESASRQNTASSLWKQIGVQMT